MVTLVKDVLVVWTEEKVGCEPMTIGSSSREEFYCEDL